MCFSIVSAQGGITNFGSPFFGLGGFGKFLGSIGFFVTGSIGFLVFGSYINGSGIHRDGYSQNNLNNVADYIPLNIFDLLNISKFY